MERQEEAGGFYYFPPVYWRALETSLRGHVVLFEAGDYAALLRLHAPPWLHYHLGASSGRGPQVRRERLLFLEAARWAQELGYPASTSAAALGATYDSLHDFKFRFDPGGEVEAAIGEAFTTARPTAVSPGPRPVSTASSRPTGGPDARSCDDP